MSDWTVYFDLGGVLSDDPWEAICLTPGKGLADRLGVPRKEMEAAGANAWLRFSLEEADESDYWSHLESLVGTSIPLPLVREAESTTWTYNPHGPALLQRAMNAADGRVGILSDNTSFWFQRQAEALGLSDIVDPSLVFVSFRQGHSKSDGRLIADARRASTTSSVFFVDDRENNIRFADAEGFRTHHFHGFSSSVDLETALSRLDR